MDMGVESLSDGVHRIHRRRTDIDGKVHVLVLRHNSFGVKVKEELAKKDLSEDQVVSSIFATETQNLLHFHSSLFKSDRELFRAFHDFSMNCGKAIATVLSSLREICRMCGLKLAFKNTVIPVVIYSNHRGTYLGSIPDLLKCAVNAKFTNTMDIGLLRVSGI